MTTLHYLPTTGNTPLTQPGARSLTSRRAGGYPAPQSLSAPAWTAGRSPRRQPIAAGIVAGACRLIPTNTPTRGGSAHHRKDRHDLTSTTQPVAGGSPLTKLENRPPADIVRVPQPTTNIRNYTKRTAPAMQVPRKMTEAGQALLHLFDVTREINKDGVITLAEVRRQRAAESRVESAFEQADAGIGIVMAAMKGGPEARTYLDQKREYELIWGELGYTDPRPANVIPMNTRNRPDHGNGPSAA